MSADHKIGASLRDTVRLFQQAAGEILSSPAGSFQALDLLEEIPDHLDIALPLVDFDPFHVIPDRVFSKGAAEADSGDHRRPGSQSPAFPAVTAAHKTLGPRTSSGPTSSSETRSSAPSLPRKSAGIAPPSVFSFGRRAIASHRSAYSSARTDDASLDSYGREGASPVSGTTKSSDMAATAPVWRTSAERAPSVHEASEGRLPGAQDHHINAARPDVVSTKRVLPAEHKRPESASADGSTSMQRADNPSPIQALPVEPLGDEPHPGDTIVRTITEIASLSEALLRGYEERHGSALTSSGSDTSLFWANADILWSSLARIPEAAATVKHRSFRRLDPERRLAVWMIDSMADALLSAMAGDTVESAATGDTVESAESILRSSPDTLDARSVSPAKNLSAGIAVPSEIDGSGATPRPSAPSASRGRGVDLAGALADAVMSTSRKADDEALPLSQSPLISTETGRSFSALERVDTVSRTNAETVAKTAARAIESAAIAPTRRRTDRDATVPGSVQNIRNMIARIESQGDLDALAEMVNDVLVRQARRHGVDLS